MSVLKELRNFLFKMSFIHSYTITPKLLTAIFPKTGKTEERLVLLLEGKAFGIIPFTIDLKQPLQGYPDAAYVITSLDKKRDTLIKELHKEAKVTLEV